MEGHIFGNFMVTVNTCRCTSMQYQRIQLHVIKCIERIMDWLALTHKPCVMTVIIINTIPRGFILGERCLGAQYISLFSVTRQFCCSFHMIIQTNKSCSCGAV